MSLTLLPSIISFTFIFQRKSWTFHEAVIHSTWRLSVRSIKKRKVFERFFRQYIWEFFYQNKHFVTYFFRLATEWSCFNSNLFFWVSTPSHEFTASLKGNQTYGMHPYPSHHEFFFLRLSFSFLCCFYSSTKLSVYLSILSLFESSFSPESLDWLGC